MAPHQPDSEDTATVAPLGYCDNTSTAHTSLGPISRYNITYTYDDCGINNKRDDYNYEIELEERADERSKWHNPRKIPMPPRLKHNNIRIQTRNQLIGRKRPAYAA